MGKEMLGLRLMVKRGWMLTSPLWPVVSWLLAIMIWNWNDRPMNSYKSSAYHLRTKLTSQTCSIRLNSTMSKNSIVPSFRAIWLII